MMELLIEYLQEQQVDPTPILQRLEQIDYPLGAWLQQQCCEINRPLLVGLNGAQGTGKSTFAAGLKVPGFIQ